MSSMQGKNQQLDQMIICLDQKGSVIEFNEAAERAFNINKVEVLNKNCFTFFKQRNISLLSSLEQSIVEKRKECHIPLIRINGKDIEWKVFYFSIEEKILSLLVGTEINSAAIEINEYKKYLEAVSDTIAGNHWWKDVNSVYLGCNDELIKTLGLTSREEVIGKTDYDLPWSATADYLVENDQEVMLAGVPQRREEIVRSNKGDELVFMVVKAPLRNSVGQIIGTVGTSIEITELKRVEKELRKAKEKAERSNKAKSDFLAVVSHELRTPLTAILGMVDILQYENVSSPDQKEYLENINTASKHLLSLINNILDFAKLNERKFRLVHVPFDLREDVFEKTFDILSAKAHEKDIALNLHYPPTLSKKFVGDPKALLQILINIIGNAIKFTDKGGVKVIVSEVDKTQEYAALKIDIEDTGIGIPPEQLDKVFDRFEQLNSSHHKAYGGTGLGLSVSQKLVQLLGGRISIQSVLDKGSIFSIYLKLELTPASLSNFVKKNIEVFPVEHKILLVEDEPLIQLVHTHKFEQLGCKVTLAKNGAEALALFTTKSFDIIFVDIGLPDITGNEVIQEMRQKQAAGIHLPIIALTAYVDEENLKKSKEAGADRILPKPIDNEQLANIFKTYLSLGASQGYVV